MSLYWLIGLLLIINGVISIDIRLRKYSHAILLLSSIVVTLFSGLRCCGWDYESYMDHYNKIPIDASFAWTDTTVEYGYSLFVYISKNIINNYHIFLCLFASITIFIASKLCINYSSYPVLSFTLFCGCFLFGQVMGQMRQPMAICLAYYFSVPLLLRQRYILVFSILLGIAFLFHKSIILMAALMPFAAIKVTNKIIVLSVLLSLIGFIMPGLIKHLLLTLIPKSFYLYTVMEAYVTYLSTSFSFSLGMIERALLTVICLWYSKKTGLYGSNLIFRIFMNLFLFGTILYFGFINVAAEFASRGTKCFYFAIIFILPTIIYHSKGRAQKLFLIGSLMWVVYLFSTFLIAPPEEYVPYTSILS